MFSLIPLHEPSPSPFAFPNPLLQTQQGPSVHHNINQKLELRIVLRTFRYTIISQFNTHPPATRNWPKKGRMGNVICITEQAMMTCFTVSTYLLLIPSVLDFLQRPDFSCGDRIASMCTWTRESFLLDSLLSPLSETSIQLYGPLLKYSRRMGVRRPHIPW